MLLRLLNFVFTSTSVWNTALQFPWIQEAEFCPHIQSCNLTEVLSNGAFLFENYVDP